MILVLGGTGYMGQAFVRALRERDIEVRSVSRRDIDYTRFEELLTLLRQSKPEFVINAAGYTGRPNVDACEHARADTLQGATLLPTTISHACAAADVPWGHLSSGCIFAGAKVVENGELRVEKDLTTPALREMVENHPERIRGFTEDDEPNFSFRQPPSSFYSGCKALAEEAILTVGRCYIWRLRMPFDAHDQDRNFLSKLLRYPRIYDNVNSLSHREDFIRACLSLWERKAPFGIYNVVNPGFTTTREIIRMIEETLKPARSFPFWSGDEDFYRHAVKTPRSNCILDPSKMLAAGIKMRPVQDALQDALDRWQPAPIEGAPA
jgi:dTDP-4-dehydrorhamnose reductase